MWKCKDGFVTFNLYGGTVGLQTNRALVSWMDREGLAPDFLKEKDWENWDWGLTTQEEFDRMGQPIAAFFLNHTRRELDEESFKRRIMLSVVADASDIMEDPQLRARDFWVEVEYPELAEKIAHPGSFVRSSETACKIQRRAPRIGEHNEEIYIRELGLSMKELNDMKSKGII